MTLNWIDVTDLPFNVILLLEQAQLCWFPGWLPQPELGIALKANPVVEWYLRNKCPQISPWVDQVIAQANSPLPAGEGLGLGVRADVRAAEIAVMNAINDLLVYVVDPAIYDRLPFLGWESSELTDLVDFKDKVIIDVGAGTGRLACLAAEENAKAVFAVEPVGNLRQYMRNKVQNLGFENLYPVDGLITDIPFPDGFADISMGGHVFGDQPQDEHREMTRITKPGGMVVLCPGNNNRDEGWHQFLVDQGYQWSHFAEPEDGTKRKYWKTIPTTKTFSLWHRPAM